MKFARLRKLAAVLVMAVALVAGFAQTQAQSSINFTIAITNICTQGSFSVSAVALFVGFIPAFLESYTPAITLQPGQTHSTENAVSTTPTSLVINGIYNSQAFSVTFTNFAFNTTYNNKDVAGGCMNAIVRSSSTGGTQPPTSTDKPIAEGQSVNQVLANLAALGVTTTQDGSEASPKLSNVSDPMLLRQINALSAQVIWVSAPGTLRSVITWDNPFVDLDLIVIGFGGCFQLAPAGYLAEVCDRAPSAPVPGVVFAVIIINWSATNQAYVLSLSQ